MFSLNSRLAAGGGIQRRTPAENFPDEDWTEVLQVNLSTVFTISRDAGRHMLESRGGVNGGAAVEAGAADKNPRGKGSIINVASLVSFQGKPPRRAVYSHRPASGSSLTSTLRSSCSLGGLTVPAYTAAKHGVLGLGKALSNEWASKGVKVNSIAPGYIATEMNTALIGNPVRSRQIMERIPAGRWGSPEDFEGDYLDSSICHVSSGCSCVRLAESDTTLHFHRRRRRVLG